MTNSFLALDFDASVRELYDRFLVRLAHVPVAGLYRDGIGYVIVVPGLEAHTWDGRPLDDWFDDSFKPVTWPVSLRNAVPSGAEEMTARSRAELHRACGVVRTWPALERDLFLAAPSAIPLRGLREDDRTAVLQVSRELSEPELRALSEGFESLGSTLPFRVEVVAENGAVAPRRRPDRIELAVSRHLAHSVPRAIREAVTRDEDVWRTQREIHDPVALSRHLDSQNPWKTEANKTCLVPTLFGAKNLRSYLSLYSQVIIDAPLADRTAEMFTS